MRTIRILIFRTLRLLMAGLLVTALAGCSGMFEAFWDKGDQKGDLKGGQQIEKSRGPSSSARVHFLGVSSFLIRDGDRAVMIDGFFSRPDRYLLRRTAPNRTRVVAVLCTLGVEMTENLCAEGSPPATVKLDAIFTMHGHFDHAMDSPLIACLTGATLIGGRVVAQIATETQEFFKPECNGKVTQTSLEAIERFKKDGATVGFTYGPITVTLVKAEHSKNLGSMILEAAGSGKDWSFPTHAFQMKLGTSVAAHVRLKDGAFLIVPSAGEIQDEFKPERFKADTVFLGIGALGLTRFGLGDKENARTYWDNTVDAVGAKTVVPIHWDSFKGPLVGKGAGLKIPFYEPLNRVLAWLSAFSNKSGVALRAPPLVKAFDPFFGTATTTR